MNWIGFIGYILIGISWAEFIKSEYLNYRRIFDYHTYVYHALFWPISVFWYLIGGRK